MNFKITRRGLIQGLGIGALSLQIPRFANAKTQTESSKNTAPWQTFKIKTTISPEQSVSALLLPVPNQTNTTYQKAVAMEFHGNYESAQLMRDPIYNSDALLVMFAKEQKDPHLEFLTTVQTRDRSAPEPLAPDEDLKTYLEPTSHMPVTGLVAELAQKIAKGRHTADGKARAFHNYICDHASRDPKVRGCGIGDINATLATGNLSGKCADLNALFVGFCRASGIPAREVFGVRVGESKQFKSIGKSGSISKAQHCRAEYYSAGRGWIAVDPADVRKVILEEKLALEDKKVQAFRDRAFGHWEMNWIVYNHARDFKYAQTPDELNFLMYPQSVGSSLDSLDPEKFKYTIEV